MKPLRRLLTTLRYEPALIGGGVSIVLTVAAAFGLEVTPDQRDALLALAGFIAAIAFGVRSQVKPMAKVRDEKERPRVAQLDPRLFGRKGRG